MQEILMRIYNTMSRKVEDFIPLEKGKVKMYCCGPTVYDFTHIGHLRKYTMDDTIKRTLRYLGFQVNHVMNITDVGHLVSDGDEGEDKLEKGAKKHGKTVWEVAEEYTKYFEKSMLAIGVEPPDITCKATDYISQMVTLVQTLEKKGFTYETDEAVYFDVSKDTNYGVLTGQKLSEKKVAVREDVHEDKSKRNPADFALWFKRVGRFADHTMHWDSPWGDGFPGWHVECSAMSMEHLGEQIDIHTGGTDHIPVHHTNEIAQSECATGKRPFVKYWMHHNMLSVNGQKMSKSLGNYFTIDDIIKKGFSPYALRLLFLQSHYRSEMNFTWESLGASQKFLSKLVSHYLSILGATTQDPSKSSAKSETNSQTDYIGKFKKSLGDDFNTPEALSVLGRLISDLSISNKVKIKMLDEFGEVLGIPFGTLVEEIIKSHSIPEEISKLAKERSEAKKNKDFKLADNIRKQISDLGYEVNDKSDGSYEVKFLDRNDRDVIPSPSAMLGINSVEGSLSERDLSTPDAGSRDDNASNHRKLGTN